MNTNTDHHIRIEIECPPNVVVCPYCDDVHDYAPDYDDYEQKGLLICFDCGKVFKYRQESAPPQAPHNYTIWCTGCLKNWSYENYKCEGGVKECEECGTIFEYENILEVTYTTTRIE